MRLYIYVGLCTSILRICRCVCVLQHTLFLCLLIGHFPATNHPIKIDESNSRGEGLNKKKKIERLEWYHSSTIDASKNQPVSVILILFGFIPCNLFFYKNERLNRGTLVRDLFGRIIIVIMGSLVNIYLWLSAENFKMVECGKVQNVPEKLKKI